MSESRIEDRDEFVSIGGPSLHSKSRRPRPEFERGGSPCRPKEVSLTEPSRLFEAPATIADGYEAELDSDAVVVVGPPPMPDLHAPAPSTAVMTPLVPAPSMGQGGSSSWPPAGGGSGFGRSHDFDPPSARIFTLKTAARAFKRYWPQFLLIWLAGSAGLMVLAYAKIKPIYQTVAVIGVIPQNWGHREKSDRDEEIQIETEASLVADPSVLRLALVDKPRLKDLELLRVYPNVQDEIGRLLKVNRRPGTSVIQVGMFTHRPDEAAEIINAVVNAFIKKHYEWTPSRTKDVINELNTLLRDAKTRLAENQKAARTIAAKLRQQGVPVDEEEDDSDGKTRSGSKGMMLAATDAISPEFHQRLQDEWRSAQVAIKKYEAHIDAIRSRRSSLKPVAGAQGDAGLEAVEDLIRADPVLIKDWEKLSQLADVVKTMRARARSKSDPMIRKYEDQLRSLMSEFERKTASLRVRYAAGKRESASEALQNELANAETMLAAQIAGAQALEKLIKSAKVQKRDGNHEEVLLDLDFARFEVRMAEESVNSLDRRYNEVSNEAVSPPPIQFLSAATPDGNKPTDHRQKILAAIPLGWGIGTFLLFLLLEARAGRVTDAEDVPERLRLPVIGIVPPIPDLRETRRRSLKRRIRSQREIDLFVQCLDHLRVVICSTGANGVGGPWRQSGSHRRCILITSAVGGEGKTTLAAQLAGRCANAGLSTLLIDADLRNPSLSWRLDASDGPGLADALMGQIDPESALRLIEDGGGFQLLPAGAPQSDPSRLLQGERLGHLITRFRSMFDVVIIDAPPILPVPDGLLIGRWTEGAVMAVRREASRFPLVQNAKQRLQAVGLPVLGVVVNGVRPFNSSYDAQYGYPSRTLVVS